MPPTLKSSGTTAALTPGAALTSLANTTGLTAGESLLLWVDTNALSANQACIVQVRVAALVGGTVRNVNGSPMTIPQGFSGHTFPISVPATVPYDILVGVVGGSATPTIPWRIDQLDR